MVEPTLVCVKVGTLWKIVANVAGVDEGVKTDVACELEYVILYRAGRFVDGTYEMGLGVVGDGNLVVM